jgi:hypothetical protein
MDKNKGEEDIRTDPAPDQNPCEDSHPQIVPEKISATIPPFVSRYGGTSRLRRREQGDYKFCP